MFDSGRIPIRHKAQQAGIRAACQLARDILLKTALEVNAGATTAQIDRFAAAEIKAKGCKSAFLGYRGFPGNICISINEEVVHGIGGSRVIQDGDVVKIDIGIFRDGWVGDNALTVPIGFQADGMPAGMQLVGRPFAEAELLNVAHVYQLENRWHEKAPALPV